MIKLTKKEKNMLCNAILAEMQTFNEYKHRKFVNTITNYQEKLQDLLIKLGA